MFFATALIMSNAISINDFKSTVALLRFPFSIFLLPVSLFSFYFIQPGMNLKTLIVLFIWHVLVYPSSNGYNSYHDRDEGPIGGLENPPLPQRLLLKTCNGFDALAIIIASLLNLKFAAFVAMYIVMSRLYSNRAIRLKKYPLRGFLTVFIFQGAWIFAGNFFAFGKEQMLLTSQIMYSMVACSGFIGCIYPLTQIYQHEADKKDNVKTLSILLGEKGTFVFSAFMFSAAAFFLYMAFSGSVNENRNFLMFNLVMLPSLIYFLWWWKTSVKDRSRINFKNTMTMLVLSSVLNNIYFLILLFK